MNKSMKRTKKILRNQFNKVITVFLLMDPNDPSMRMHKMLNFNFKILTKSLKRDEKLDASLIIRFYRKEETFMNYYNSMKEEDKLLFVNLEKIEKKLSEEKRLYVQEKKAIKRFFEIALEREFIWMIFELARKEKEI